MRTPLRTSLLRLLLGPLGCLALQACTSDSSVGAPPAAPVDWHAFDVPRAVDAGTQGATAQERAAAEGYVAALASPGMALLGPRLTADARFQFPGVADARGKEAVLKAHDGLLGAFDARATAVARVWHTENAHAVEWTMSGVQNRDWMGVTATHRPVVLRAIALLWTKDDGTITDVHAIFDVAAVKAQLGAGPRELAALPVPAMAAGAPQSVDQARTMDEAATVELARSWVNTLERPDDAAFLAAVADDVQIESPERAAPMRGKDELKAYFKALHKAVGQVDAIIENAWGFDRTAVVEYTLNGEQLGAYGWVPAQRDRVLRLHVVDVIQTQGGKVAHVWRYEDPAEAMTPAP